MKKIVFFLLFTSTVFSQTINDYQFVIVPTKFGFNKNLNPFRISTKSKFMLTNIGFTVFYDNDAFPKEIASDKCKVLLFDIVEKNTMMSTNITIILKDCFNKIIFSSEGKSREKEFETAYNEALQQAFAPLKKANYKFNEAIAIPKTATIQLGDVLFAQPILNGFQLIDNTPKVIFKLLKTSQKDLFFAKKQEKEGVFLMKDSNWFFEYYENEKLISEKIEVKF